MNFAAIQSVLEDIDFKPRPYQVRIIEKCVNMFLGEHSSGGGTPEPQVRSVMIESPTGSGKTCMGLVIAKALQRLLGVRVGWVAMRENLLYQAQEEARRSNIHLEPIHYISMFQKAPTTEIDLLIIDEAQHDASSSCAHIHNTIRPTWILGLTATPFRSDRIRLCFDKVVHDAGIHQLIDDGYLSRFDHYTIPEWKIESLVEIYCSDRERWGKSIFFFHRTTDCHKFNKLLREQGVRADVVTGNSDRESQLNAFRNGEVEALSNCMVLTEGFDDPTIKTAWVRPSCKGATIQMAGRALRIDPSQPIKQIIQCQETPHPFVKTAKPNKQFLWHPTGWRSLTINPQIELCAHNTGRAIAQTIVTLPTFLSKKRPPRKRNLLAS